MRKKKVVVIGGGTGTYTTLLGLKKYPIELSVIVSMMDSGGSNRVIRDEFGLLPTSDLRQAIVALASNEASETMRKLFTYRYSQGTGIAGMTFGNLFMAALTDILGSQEKAIEETCQLLDVSGDIIPVTLDQTNLVARYDNGKQVLGEHYIDEPGDDVAGHRIVGMEVFPPAEVNTKAVKAIEEADMVVLSPGDLYTSLIPNLLIKGAKRALKNTKAKRVYVINLMTKYGQTTGFKASNFLEEIRKYMGGNFIDYVLINNNRQVSEEILRRYEEEMAALVVDDLEAGNGIKVIRTDLMSDMIYEKPKSDKLMRSLIRHDPDKLAAALMKKL